MGIVWFDVDVHRTMLPATPIATSSDVTWTNTNALLTNCHMVKSRQCANSLLAVSLRCVLLPHVTVLLPNTVFTIVLRSRNGYHQSHIRVLHVLSRLLGQQMLVHVYNLYLHIHIVLRCSFKFNMLLKGAMKTTGNSAGETIALANWSEYRSRIVRFVRSKVHNDVLAEDIAHGALMKAWERRDSLASGEALLPWLFQITMNAVRDHYRARRFDSLPEDFDVADEPSHNDLQQLATCLTSMMKDLKEPYRSVFIRSEVDGVPMSTIAVEHGLSVSGVKSRVQRARSKIREAMLACCSLEVNAKGQITNAGEHECYKCDP